MTKQVRKPRNINYDLSGGLVSRAIAAGIDLPPGWQFFVVDADKGYARVNSKTCTVPTWALGGPPRGGKLDPDYELYYAAHEAAHAWNFKRNANVCDHNDGFYVEFKRLCPPRLWHYERGYKSTAPIRAGISTDPATNIADAPAVSEHQRIAAGPGGDDSAYDDYVAAHPKLKKALTNVPDRERLGFIRGWAKLDPK